MSIFLYICLYNRFRNKLYYLKFQQDGAFAATLTILEIVKKNSFQSTSFRLFVIKNGSCLKLKKLATGNCFWHSIALEAKRNNTASLTILITKKISKFFAKTQM